MLVRKFHIILFFNYFVSHAKGERAVGASTVMGTYTRNNQDTLSYQLQRTLNEQTQNVRARVINAGIAGYSLNDQRRMIERLLARLSVDHYILYTGFNDLSIYCRNTAAKSAKKESYALPALQLPNWLITTELITKNTVSLRTSMARKNTMVDPNVVDTQPFEDDMNKLAATLKATGQPVLVIGNSWAFRRDMPLEKRIELSETARYYKNCFDTDGLEILFEKHNNIIERVAKSHNLRYFNLHSELPGGNQYFGDSTHFSITGTQKAAKIISSYITERPSLSIKEE